MNNTIASNLKAEASQENQPTESAFSQCSSVSPVSSEYLLSASIRMKRIEDEIDRKQIEREVINHEIHLLNQDRIFVQQQFIQPNQRDFNNLGNNPNNRLPKTNTSKSGECNVTKTTIEIEDIEPYDEDHLLSFSNLGGTQNGKFSNSVLNFFRNR